EVDAVDGRREHHADLVGQKEREYEDEAGDEVAATQHARGAGGPLCDARWNPGHSAGPLAVSLAVAHTAADTALGARSVLGRSHRGGHRHAPVDVRGRDAAYVRGRDGADR